MPDVKHFDPQAVIGVVQELLWQRGWADTAIQDIVVATGVSRSSLYSTFGGKPELCLAAVRSYLAEQAVPAFTALETGGRGLPTISAFFGGLITARCRGPQARWGCLATNLQAGADLGMPELRQALAEHHQHLNRALRAALLSAERLGQLRPDIDLAASAEWLALLAYGINIRAKAGAGEQTLRRAVTASLAALRRPGDPGDV